MLSKTTDLGLRLKLLTDLGFFLVILGAAIDQGVAYVLMVVALALTYFIH